MSSIDHQWKWTMCHFSHEPTFHFTNSVIFKQCSSEDYKPSIFENVSISMSKSLIFCEEVGWNWHKSWNLPNITITYKMELGRNSDKEIWVLFSSLSKVPSLLIKAAIHLLRKVDSNEGKMVDLGLKGDTLLRINDKNQEKIEFSSVKIMTTSFSHNGEKFYLFLNFYEVSGDIKKPLLSYMSSPFFVDSREAARKNSNSEYKQILPFMEPFLPGFLFKDFVKRKNRSVKDKGDIENSFEGLYNYLSAPNIRFKVKHPLFLLIKFSEAFSLYCKTSVKLQNENVIIAFQNTLFTNYSNYMSKNQKKAKSDDFIILANNYELKDKTKTQKINGLLHIIDNYLIKIAMNKSDIPHGYEHFKNLDELQKKYKDVYPYLNSEKMFSMSHMFKKNEVKKTPIFMNEEEQTLKKKLKVEYRPTNLVGAENADRTPIIKEIDFSSYDGNAIKVISSTNSLINKPSTPTLAKKIKRSEVVPEKKEDKTMIEMKITNRCDQLENFMNFYNFYWNSMMVNPFNFAFGKELCALDLIGKFSVSKNFGNI